MTEEKLIVIGCDDTANLSAILHSIREAAFFPHNIISATRLPDLIGIAKSVSADLVILCFRNNQQVLNDFYSFVKKTEVPVICLLKKYEPDTLRWPRENVVFTFALESVASADSFVARINSVFLLRRNNTAGVVSGSFAEVAIQMNHTRDLGRYVMELDQKVEMLQKIKDRIAELSSRVDDHTRSDLTSIVSMIKLSAGNNKIWDDFKLYFEKTDPVFLTLLSQKYPLLTPIDLKYCCYLKMNMSNDDIRNLLGINQESVRTHQYRLKKKMSLAKDQDLRNYLMTVCERVQQVA
jgi:DNA-binding CsgD family transcriptional regulator